MSVTEKLVEPTNCSVTQAPSGGQSGSEENEWSDRDDHPLRNDLILGILSGFVRRCDLQTCRVVSKKWNLHTIPHMRATFKVTIGGSQYTEQNDDESSEEEETRRIEDFVKLFDSNELGIPFAKFKLGPFRMTDGVGKQFLQLCGETITEIDLDEKFGKKFVYGIEDVSELLKASPNIQGLVLPYNLVAHSGSVMKLFPDSIPTLPFLKKIKFRRDYERKGLKFCPTLIDELFTAAPNILDIVLEDGRHSAAGTGDENAIGISTVLNSIEKLGMESSIQSLDLGRPINVQLEQLWRMGEKENGLKLKTLNLSTEGIARRDIRAVQTQLTTCFKNSLQHFSVDKGVVDNLMEFPYMPNLKSFISRTSPYFLPKPVNMNKIFPVLETFTFYQNYDSDIQLFSQFESCPTVKSFIASNSDLRINTFHDILRVFPNLTKLSLEVQDDGVQILREMWSQMTGLESLAIQGFVKSTDDWNLESLFIGIPTQALKGLTHVVNGLDKMTSKERRDAILKLRNEHCRLPSIRNLTKLRHLDLDVDGGVTWRGEINLTDLTAYLVFYSMRQLNHLNVKRCRFTKTCCEILTKETGLDTWHFENKRYENIVCPFLLH